MDKISIIITILLAIITLIMTNFSFQYMMTNKKEKKNRESDKTKKTYVELILQSEEPYQKINKIIDDFISEAAQTYLTLNGHTREDYMNKEFVDKYEQYVLAFLQKNMSPTIKEVIGLCYDIENNEDELKRILKLRTKLFLIGVVAGNNVSLQD